jgi:hypothetical protein
MKTAADVKAERIRLQSLVAEKESELKGEVMQVKDKFNLISGVTSLFSDKKKTKSTRAVLDTGINLLIGKVIAKRIGFLPTFITPFISKSITEQVMKLNLQPYIIEALDWVIEKTDDNTAEIEQPVVFKADAAFSSKTVIAQPVIVPAENVDVTP